jgi:hypothetical protein
MNEGEESFDKDVKTMQEQMTKKRNETKNERGYYAQAQNRKNVSVMVHRTSPGARYHLL